jgi:hypothetical protein
MADEPLDGHDDLMAQEQRSMTLSPISQKLLQLLEDGLKKNKLMVREGPRSTRWPMNLLFAHRKNKLWGFFRLFLMFAPFFR